jgi:hypothetical protein
LNKAHLYSITIAGALLLPMMAAAQLPAATTSAEPVATPSAPAATPASPVTTPAAPATTANTTTAATDEDPNEIICREGDLMLGSRIPGQRICQSRKAWNDLAYRSQRETEQIQMNRPKSCHYPTAC